jgi:hypothetical protein
MTMPSVNAIADLSHFQDAFADALLSDRGDFAGEAVAQLRVQPGFAVYRNTVMKGCVDALQANFPAVTRLVGEEWLRAAGARFARAHLPHAPSLIDYGAEFPDFLAEFAPAAELPYLASVARLDRFWTEAHIAADAGRLPAADVAGLDSDRFARSVLMPHPSARWRWFPDLPIYSIWVCNRSNAAAETLSAIEWRGEGALLVRPEDSVDAIEIGAAESAFLDACSRGEPLGAAGIQALSADGDADLAQLLARLLRTGAFAGLEISNIWET